MIKKILLGLLLILILAVVGGYVLITTKGDILLHKFGAYVEETTGAPLALDKLPSLTFFPSPGLDLGKATWGRKDGGLFVSFSHASVRVSAKALLTGRIDITSMNLDDLDVVVRQKELEQARKPAQAGPNQVKSPPPAAHAEATASPADLETTLNRILTATPNALTVHRGKIMVVETNGTTNTFNHVELALQNVRPGANTSLELQALAERTPGRIMPTEASFAGTSPLAGELKLEASASLIDSSLFLKIQSAMFTPQTGLLFKTPVELAGEGSYALKTNGLSLSNLTLSAPGLKATLWGSTAFVPALLRDFDHEGTGTLKFKMDGSPRALLNALGHSVPTTDPHTLDKTTLAAAVTLDKGKLSITGLEGSIDSTSISGDLNIRMAPPALQGTMSVGDLNLDAYLPPAPPTMSANSGATTTPPAPAVPKKDETSRPSTVTTSDQMPWPEIDLTLRVNSLKIHAMELAEIQARAEGKDGAYAINPLTFRMFGSPVTAGVKAVGARPAEGRTAGSIQAAVSANISAPQINLADASRALFKKDTVSGAAALNASMACDTRNPLATFSGKGSLSAEPLTLKVDLLPANTPGAGNAARGGTFDKAILTFEADKGVVTITDCSLTSPRLTATGKGTVNLPHQTLDIAGAVQVTGMAVLPVRLTGPISSPTYSLNARTTMDAVDQTLKTHGVDLEREVKRGLGQIFKKK